MLGRICISLKAPIFGVVKIRREVYGMIYLVSDIHGDFSGLLKQILGYKKTLTEEDILIVLGDMGIWEETLEALRLLCDSVPFKILFIDGNHESFPLIHSFPKEEMWGGEVRRIAGTYYLCRGEVFTLPCGDTTVRIATLGGGTSRDRDQRTEGLDWFPEEEIGDEDVERLVENVKRAEGIDFLLSHAPSATAKLQLCAEHTNFVGKRMETLTPSHSDRQVRNAISLLDAYSFVCVSGHEHIEREMRIGQREYRLIYKNIVPLVRERTVG